MQIGGPFLIATYALAKQKKKGEQPRDFIGEASGEDVR